MKAAVYTRFGPPEVVRIEDVPMPVIGPRDVLIRSHATTVTTADWRLRARQMPRPVFTLIAPLVLGFRGPRQRILGTDCAGVVEAVGAEVTSFRPGDRVLAVLGMGMGAHAELVRVPEGGAVVPIPANLSFEDAVAIPFGGAVALRYLRDLAHLRPGQRVLINGASGALGVAAVQIARHLGAEVIGVCSTPNIDRVRSLGASAVIDRTRTDFTHGPGVYDIIFDTLGTTSLRRCRRVLAPRGQFLAVIMGLTEFWQMLCTATVGRWWGRRVRGTMVTTTKADLAHLLALAEDGHLRPVVDSTYTLDTIVEAHRRVDSGRKVGSVVVTVGTR